MDTEKLKAFLHSLECAQCRGTRVDTLLIVIDDPRGQDAQARVQCVRCHLFWSYRLQEIFNPPPPVEPGPPPISFDEVIEVTRALSDFQGSLTDLIGPRAA